MEIVSLFFNTRIVQLYSIICCILCLEQIIQYLFLEKKNYIHSKW